MKNKNEQLNSSQVKLIENEQRLILATQSAKIGVWEYDMIANVLIWDNLMCKIYGIESTDFSGTFEDWKSRLHPEDVQKTTQDLQDGISGKKPFDTEFRVVWPDKTVHHIKAHGLVARDLEGNPIKIVGVNWDITETKKQADKFFQLSRAVENNPISVVITDNRGLIEYVNPKFVEITGYALSEVVGKNPNILKSGEQSQEYYNNLWDTIKKGDVWHGEFHNKKKNGELYWEEASISSIKDSHNMITHYVAVKEDISLRKEQQAEIFRKTQELKEAHDKLQELSVTDPLTGLSNRRGFEEKASQYLKLIKRNKQHAFLFFIDIDNMKWINDNLGHNEGDAVLKEVANILKNCFRETDIITRMGGDEFSVLVTMMDLGGEEFIINRLQEFVIQRNAKCFAPRQPFSLSIGGASADLQEIDDIQAILGQADKSMYIQKWSKKE